MNTHWIPPPIASRGAFKYIFENLKLYGLFLRIWVVGSFRTETETSNNI